jgi:hypothetical protein
LLIFGHYDRIDLRFAAEMAGMSETCFGLDWPSGVEPHEDESTDRPTPKREVGVGSSCVSTGGQVGFPTTAGIEE